MHNKQALFHHILWYVPLSNFSKHSLLIQDEKILKGNNKIYSFSNTNLMPFEDSYLKLNHH